MLQTTTEVTLKPISAKNLAKAIEEIEPILKEFGLELKPENIENDDSLDGASVIGNIIFYRRPTNVERFHLSIFHEIGHRVQKRFDHCYFQYETDAWFEGIQLAVTHGFIFSPETLRWANDQLCTYLTAERLSMPKIIGLVGSLKSWLSCFPKRKDGKEGSAIRELNEIWNAEERERRKGNNTWGIYT